MKNRFPATLALCLGLTLSGCALILGGEDAAPPATGTLRIDYVETLRDSASLRGESFRDTKVFGDPAAAALALHQPVAVAADAFRVYVADRSPARLVIFDRGERNATIVSGPSPTLPVPAAGFSSFIDPTAVAIVEGGTVYVADAQLGRVVGLDRTGAMLLLIGHRGELASPAGLAVDLARDRLYVADQSVGRVRVFTLRGHMLFDIGGSGKKNDLKMPVGVAVTRTGMSYVLDARALRVFVYDAEGKPLRSFRLIDERGAKLVKPAGIALDSAGHVYVTDTVSNSVVVYGQDGVFLQRWGSMGSRRDELWSPAGIFIDSRDTIYIADQMNGRVQVYQYGK